jgi:hypothetical protein
VQSSPAAGPRARTKAAKRGSKTIVTPAGQQLDVHVFLAALAAGKSVPTALKMAGLSERRVARWIAFNSFGPAVKKAKRKGWLSKKLYGITLFHDGRPCMVENDASHPLRARLLAIISHSNRQQPTDNLLRLKRLMLQSERLSKGLGKTGTWYVSARCLA